MWPGLRKSTVWVQITPSYIFMNIFHSEMRIYFLLTSEESPLHSTLGILILFNSYKQILSYDSAKLKKVGDFYVLTWLIFTGPVTYVALITFTMAMLSTTNWITCPAHWLPNVAAASTTGNIFTTIDNGQSINHSRWNHIGSRNAPYHHLPKASVYTYRLGFCKPRSHSSDTPFHSSTKTYYHIISALASRFSLIKWFGWLTISYIA